MRAVSNIVSCLLLLVLVACGAPPPVHDLRDWVDYTTVRLADGRILVTGGIRRYQGKVADAQICDLTTKQWVAAGAMHDPRLGHSATLLADGRVLVAGGTSSTFLRTTALTSAELYDPTTNRWTSVGALPSPHTGHAAVLLRDGRVLLSGGRAGGGSGDAYLTSVAAFDPRTNRWQALAPLTEAREQHTAIVLRDGRVLVIGGLRPGAQDAQSAELYDPATDRWRRVASPLSAQHVKAPAVLLDDGRVLLHDQARDEREEIYDPQTDRWERADTTIPYNAIGRLPCP